MIVISYQVTLLEPLLATRIAGDPNSAVSYPYVPGGAVRGREHLPESPRLGFLGKLRR